MAANPAPIRKPIPIRTRAATLKQLSRRVGAQRKRFEDALAIAMPALEQDALLRAYGAILQKHRDDLDALAERLRAIEERKT